MKNNGYHHNLYAGITSISWTLKARPTCRKKQTFLLKRGLFVLVCNINI